MSKSMLAAVLLATTVIGSAGIAFADASLTIDSWRPDDLTIWQDKILPVFMKEHPDIKVTFQPTDSTQYNSALNSKLQGGSEADIITCRPFDASLALFKAGNLVDLTALPGMDNFSDTAKVAWSTDDGDTAGRIAEAQRALASSDCREAPVASDEWIRGVADASLLPYCIRVQIPRDGEALLIEDADRALGWRTSARQAIRWGLEHGYAIDALMADDGDAYAYYLMTRTPRQHLTLDR